MIDYAAPIRRQGFAICKPTVAPLFAKSCVSLHSTTRLGILEIEACLAFANCSVPLIILNAKNCSGMVSLTKCSVEWKHRSVVNGIWLL